ncbi:hypothetical protein ACEQPO_11055 [Bacillus sp. SL00103]
MAIVNFDVDVNQDEIRNYIYQQLEEALNEVLFTWDIEQWQKRTCMSKELLEKTNFYTIQE